MLARSTSSRRRRASRSAASSPQRAPVTRNNKTSVAQAAAATTAVALQVDETNRRSRRASAAAGMGTGSVPLLVCNRSPRNSIAVPVGSEGSLLSASTVSNRSCRGSFAGTEDDEPLHPESSLSSRSARGSFAEGFSDSLLLPGSGTGSRSARNSFSVPEIDNPLLVTPGSRSARGSFAVPEPNADLLQPPQGTRSARGSFSCPNSEIQITVPGSRSARASFSVPSDNQETLMPSNRNSRTPRGSLVPPDTNTMLSPRNSLVPDSSRNPRGSIAPDALPTRSPRGSVVLENINRSPRTSITAEMSRSPRGSITSEFNRSPRGSITAEFNRSPRGSLAQEPSRSRRGSTGPDGLPLRSPRTSPRGSVPDAYSPRGSIAASGLQGSPRGSVDLALPGSSKGGLTTSGSYRLATRGGNQTNHDSESRRASSSVSQVSVDDRRQLCEHTKLNAEAGPGLHVYGSVVYQLKDANMEASGTCDFVLRALRVVFKTVTVTIILVCLTALPIIMLIMGVNYLRDCPEEPNLPVYMVVGGSFGAIKMMWIIWRQIKSRRYERLDIVTPPPTSNYEETLLTASAGTRGASFALSLFLVVWFILGNYWTFRIYFPEFEPELYEPNRWCSKALYIFSLVHLGIIYFVVAAILILAIVLMCCHVFSCSLVVRYK